MQWLWFYRVGLETIFVFHGAFTTSASRTMLVPGSDNAMATPFEASKGCLWYTFVGLVTRPWCPILNLNPLNDAVGMLACLSSTPNLV